MSPSRIARLAFVAHILCFVLPIGIHVLRGDGWPVVVSSATTLAGAGPLLYAVGILTQATSVALVVWAVWALTASEGVARRPIEWASALLLMPGALLAEVLIGQQPPPPPVYAILLLGLGTAARLGAWMGPAVGGRPDRRVRAWAVLVFALAVFSQATNQAAEGIGLGLHVVTVRAAGAGPLVLLVFLRPAAWIWLTTLLLSITVIAAMAFTWHVLAAPIRWAASPRPSP